MNMFMAMFFTLSYASTVLSATEPSAAASPNGYNIGIIYKASTSSGKTEIKTLYDADYQRVTAASTTCLTAPGDNNAEIYLFGEFNHDGRPDCYVVKKNGASGKTEVHILDGAQDYNAYAATYNGLSSNVQTVLGTTGSNHLWEFLLGDYDGDNIPDLYAVKRMDVGDKLLIRVLDGADNFGSYLVTSTNLPALAGGYLSYQMALGNFNSDSVPDLYLIETTAASGQTEVHVVDGASGYSTWAGADISAILPSTGANRECDFLVADYDGDYVPDLYWVDRCAASGKVEVHIMDGTDDFQSWICHGTTTVASVGANDAVMFNFMLGLQKNYTVPVYTYSSVNGITNYTILNDAVQVGIRRGAPLSIKTPFPTNNPFMWHAVELPVWMTVYGSGTYVSMLTNGNFTAWASNSAVYFPPTFGNASTYNGTGGLRITPASNWYAKTWGYYGGGSVTHGSDAYGDYARWMATSVEPPPNCGNPAHDPDSTGYHHLYDPAVGLWVREGTAGHDFGQVLPVSSFVNGWVTVRLRMRWNSMNEGFFVRIFQGYGNNSYFSIADSRTLPALIMTPDGSVRDYLLCYNLDAQYAAAQAMDGTGKTKYLAIVLSSATPIENHNIDIYHIILVPGIGTKDALEPSVFLAR